MLAAAWIFLNNSLTDPSLSKYASNAVTGEPKTTQNTLAGVNRMDTTLSALTLSVWTRNRRRFRSYAGLGSRDWKSEADRWPNGNLKIVLGATIEIDFIARFRTNPNWSQKEFHSASRIEGPV
jgi:hypothetical protein